MYNWKFIQNVEYKEVHDIGQKKMKNYQLDNIHNQLTKILRMSKNRILRVSKNTSVWLLKQESELHLEWDLLQNTTAKKTNERNPYIETT